MAYEECGQDFMAGTICSLPKGHDGPHGTTCQECGQDWYSGKHAETCSHFDWDNEPPWKLVDFWDYTDEAPGVTLIVDIRGVGQVQIEDWYTPNSGGVDCYMVEGGRCVDMELGERLGYEVYEYLTDDWLQEVKDTYYGHLESVNINRIKQEAVERAMRVPVEPPASTKED